MLFSLRKIAAFIPALILAATIFTLLTAAVLCAVVLLALGILALPVAAGMATGLLRNVATDLSPPAMLLAGVFCVSAAGALACGLILTAPRAFDFFRITWVWFRLHPGEATRKELFR